MPPIASACAVLAFLLGSIPFGYLIYRMSNGGDIRRHGSGNIGATNVLRTAGKGWGVLTLLLDAAKGYLALWIALDRGLNGAALALCLLLVVAGHLFTPWLRFRGGKGVATGLGALLCLAPRAALGGLLVWLVFALLWRYVSLASVAAAALLPGLVWWLYRARYPLSVPLAAAMVSALIIWRHGANLARLRAGTEPRLGQRSAS